MEQNDKKKKIMVFFIFSYLHPDCLKCAKCTLACHTKIMSLRK